MKFLRKLFGLEPKQPVRHDKGNNVDHALNSSTETTNQKKRSQKRNEIENEKEEWFLQTKRKKRKGPYTLKELTAVFKGFTVNDGIRIRKDKSGQWVAWVNAAELYPMLPKPRLSVKPSSSISGPEARAKGTMSDKEGLKQVVVRSYKEKPVKKDRGENNNLPIRRDGKLSFFALLFGLHRRKVWYILPKGKRASGPYCLKELKEKFTGTRVIGGLKIRKGKKGQWISWLNAIETYPLLAYTNISISKKKPKKLNLKHNRSKHSVNHALKAKTETTNQKKCSEERSEIEGEKEEWFLMKKKQTQHSSAAGKWFKDPFQRNEPLTPADFDLFEAPSYSLKKWAEAVSLDPWHVHCSVVKIGDLGTTTRTLFDILKQRYDLTSSEAVDIFNNYLGAACPECFGGLTGELFQTIESSKNAAGVISLGGDSGLQRIFDGTCASCPSKEYYVVWHGDRNSSYRDRDVMLPV